MKNNKLQTQSPFCYYKSFLRIMLDLGKNGKRLFVVNANSTSFDIVGMICTK